MEMPEICQSIPFGVTITTAWLRSYPTWVRASACVETFLMKSY
ncbi:hypothetical protein RSSM_03208 [Rhodopirellula sallentina SM41]|uniref:Uncharacterized protein n=1 Tax=Rhodopirellula sallentina SM41 TaxID=1263870 RepID=M5UC13_9BACT|nr:hypothetical protein RSSM_03208 [Rhodopirellula sallentina SM41]